MIIEQFLIEKLNQWLDVPVYAEVPQDPPERFAVLERVGLKRENHVTDASIAFQSHSTKSLYDAATLDGVVRAAVWLLETLPEISGVRLASSYNHTDPETKRYRYQSTFEIYFVDTTEV